MTSEDILRIAHEHLARSEASEAARKRQMAADIMGATWVIPEIFTVRPGFITGDWSVTYPAVSICHRCGRVNVTEMCVDCPVSTARVVFTYSVPAHDVKPRDVFPRQAMRTWR